MGSAALLGFNCSYARFTSNYNFVKDPQALDPHHLIPRQKYAGQTAKLPHGLTPLFLNIFKIVSVFIQSEQKIAIC